MTGNADRGTRESLPLTGVAREVPVTPRRGACRFCRSPLSRTFIDLGLSPLCESYVAPDQIHQGEQFYPLHAYVCDECFLVQIEEYVSGEEIFRDYAYFSSYSDSWLDHARRYVEQVSERWHLGPRHFVVEIASNDGYLLRNFVARGIPCLGIDPAANVAQVAIERGVPTRILYFTEAVAHDLAREGVSADLLIGNNVLAHVPNLNDFVAGLRVLLADQGVLTMEFPHLMRLVERNQFDTIYHEHFCYFSLLTVRRILAAQGLTIFDVEELPTHGGSLRIYVRHASCAAHPVLPAVQQLVDRELQAGYTRPETYAAFAERVAETKCRLLAFLIEVKRQGRQIVGYGAPGKGNTLLNYCGIRRDFLDYTVDRNPYKQGKFLPGTRIPICPPERIAETRPDYVLILPWNLRDEIAAQLSRLRDWGGRCVVAIPQLEIFDPGGQEATPRQR